MCHHRLVLPLLLPVVAAAVVVAAVVAVAGFVPPSIFPHLISPKQHNVIVKTSKEM